LIFKNLKIFAIHMRGNAVLAISCPGTHSKMAKRIIASAGSPRYAA